MTSSVFLPYIIKVSCNTNCSKSTCVRDWIELCWIKSMKSLPLPWTSVMIFLPLSKEGLFFASWRVWVVILTPDHAFSFTLVSSCFCERVLWSTPSSSLSSKIHLNMSFIYWAYLIYSLLCDYSPTNGRPIKSLTLHLVNGWYEKK